MSIKSRLLQKLNTIYGAVSHLPKVGKFMPLRGTFSASEEVRSGKTEGEIIFESQFPGVCKPGSITEQAKCDQHDHQPWPVFWAKSDKPRLVGRMHLWRNQEDRLCTEASYNITTGDLIKLEGFLGQIIVSSPYRLEGAWTSLASTWCDGNNYYHWMLDGLTRLLLCEKLPEEVNILIPHKRRFFVDETIELLGLKNKIYSCESQCIQPDRYYFCAPTAMTGVWNPLGCQWLRRAFAGYYNEEQTGPPVFLTRRGVSRTPQQLEIIETIFRSSGFEIVDCGTISVREQIAKVSSAKLVAGIHGAAMTNILWAPQKTPVLEIFQSNYLNACYEQIAIEGKLKYTAVVLEKSNKINAITSWLSDFCK